MFFICYNEALSFLYFFFVRLFLYKHLKFFLLGVACVFTAMLLTLSSSTSYSFKEKKIIPNRAFKIVYKGTNNKGKAFSLYSEMGKEIEKNHFNLKNVRLVAANNKKKSVIVNAHEAVYRKNSDKIWLAGEVTISYPDGTVLQTPHAFINLKTGQAEGSSTVTGVYKNHKLKAHGFEALKNGKHIRFLGKPTIYA